MPGLVPQIERVTARVLIRPLPMALLGELFASGHLAVDLRDQVPTHVVGGATLEWRTGGRDCVP